MSYLYTSKLDQPGMNDLQLRRGWRKDDPVDVTEDDDGDEDDALPHFPSAGFELSGRQVNPGEQTNSLPGTIGSLVKRSHSAPEATETSVGPVRVPGFVDTHFPNDFCPYSVLPINSHLR